MNKKDILELVRETNEQIQSLSEKTNRVVVDIKDKMNQAEKLELIGIVNDGKRQLGKILVLLNTLQDKIYEK